MEVASAVRPGAHVLQVTNGKGASFEEATAGALLEAAELWAAERARVDVWDDAATLAARYGDDAVVTPEALAPERAEPSWAALRLAWRTGQDLLGGAPALVPACAVHCPPAGGPLLGPAVVGWTSNGMGAHEERAAALLHALLEVVERDLARAGASGGIHGGGDRARGSSIAARSRAGRRGRPSSPRRSRRAASGSTSSTRRPTPRRTHPHCPAPPR